MEEKSKKHESHQEQALPKEDAAESRLETDSQKNTLSKIDLPGNSLPLAMHSGLGIASPFTRENFLTKSSKNSPILYSLQIKSQG